MIEPRTDEYRTESYGNFRLMTIFRISGFCRIYVDTTPSPHLLMPSAAVYIIHWLIYRRYHPSANSLPWLTNTIILVVQWVWQAHKEQRIGDRKYSTLVLRSQRRLLLETNGTNKATIQKRESEKKRKDAEVELKPLPTANTLRQGHHSAQQKKNTCSGSG